MGPQSSEHRGISLAEPFQIRRTLSSSSEFSDPGGGGGENDTAAEQQQVASNKPPSATRNVSSSSSGITVPAFLQPLLGLEFVPYLPSDEKKSRLEQNNHNATTSSSDDDYYDELVLLRTPTTTNGAARGSTEEEYDDTEAELDDMDQHSNGEEEEECLNEISQELGSTAPNTGQRKKFFHRTRENRPIRKAIGKTFSAIKNGRMKHRDGSMEDGTDRTSPRRRRTLVGVKDKFGSFSDAASSATPASSTDRHLQWTSINEQLQGLRSLEERAHTVSRRAAVIEGQITTLAAEASELQQALAKVLDKLHHEEGNLESTERELQTLKDNFRDASKQLAESLESIHRGMPLASNPPSSLPSPKTSSVESEEELQAETIDKALLTRRRSYTEDGRHERHLSAKELRCESFDLLPELHAPMANRRRANTDPQPPTTLPASTSFMRVNDLELDSSSCASTASLRALDDALEKRLVEGTSEDLFSLDENVALILCGLAELGLQVSTDESNRFSPTGDTQRVLQSKKCLHQDGLADWPFYPWHVAKDKDILVWTGGVDHKGFGHDWPVVKARCIVRTSPRNLLDFLMDSSQLKKYNKMSQGREDVFVLQEGVDTRPENSVYGFAGDARIMRALNKPKLLPKTIEMLSLWYTKPVPHAPNAYMTVSRSVWENATGTPKHSNRIRSEMLLGVNLLRPCADGCELTTITHVFAPGVPEVMAKRMAPQSAANMMREIQNIFS